MSSATQHFQVGARVQGSVGGRNVVGTVVEDRGPLAARRGQLVRVQLDWSDVAEPVEVEKPAATLLPRPMTREEREAMERVVTPPAKDLQGRLVKLASNAFHGPLRNVSLGIWPDHLAGMATQSLGHTVSLQDAIAALDAMAKVGAAAKRPSGIYVASDWLLQLLDESEQQPERARRAHITRRGH